MKNHKPTIQELINRLTLNRSKLYDVVEMLDSNWDDKVKDRFYIRYVGPIFKDSQSFKFHASEMLKVLDEVRNELWKIEP